MEEPAWGKDTRAAPWGQSRTSSLVFIPKVFNVAPMILRSSPHLWPRWLLLAGVTASAWAQTGNYGGNSLQVDVANLREDVRGLMQRVGDLTVRLEQLERENAELRRKADTSDKAYVTLAQLNDAVADLNGQIKSAVAGATKETLERVGRQMEALAKQTNAALDSLAKNVATRPTVQPSFSDNYPKDAVNYTVQKGDTVAEIAKKTGAKVQDIITANKLSDPSHIVVGQTLVVPGGK
jgi:LysM repeat protein